MPELDFGNIYSPNGKIIQHRYAQKAVDSASTIMAISNKNGVVFFVTKPAVSKLHILESDCRIKRISSNAYMAYTGILTDGAFVHHICKDAVRDYVSSFDSNINAEYLRKILFEYMYMFTSNTAGRILGSSVFAAVRDDSGYSLLHADCTGKVTKWNACAVGKGERRATTELEKLNIDSMSIEQMVEEGIRILQVCHDSLTDVDFDIEVGCLTDEFVRLKSSEVHDIRSKYSDIEDS